MKVACATSAVEGRGAITRESRDPRSRFRPLTNYPRAIATTRVVGPTTAPPRNNPSEGDRRKKSLGPFLDPGRCRPSPGNLPLESTILFPSRPRGHELGVLTPCEVNRRTDDEELALEFPGYVSGRSAPPGGGVEHVASDGPPTVDQPKELSCRRREILDLPSGALLPDREDVAPPGTVDEGSLSEVERDGENSAGPLQLLSDAIDERTGGMSPPGAADGRARDEAHDAVESGIGEEEEPVLFEISDHPVAGRLDRPGELGVYVVLHGARPRRPPGRRALTSRLPDGRSTGAWAEGGGWEALVQRADDGLRG